MPHASSLVRRAAATFAAGAMALAGLAAAPAPSADLATSSVATSGTERPAYEPSWAPAARAKIHPGVQVNTAGAGQCTSNFIFANVVTDPETGVESLADLYIGMAAHCSGTGDATSTNGCVAGSLPLGTQVAIDGARVPGIMAYNSWLSMQERGDAPDGACGGNDFALVKIHPADYGLVNPSLPVWGGPHGIASSVPTETDLYSWGNSGLRLERQQLSPKIETKVATNNGGWTHVVYAMSPGVPGDSGSGHVDQDGRAFGVTSTLILLPQPAGNGITDLGLALDYARTATGLDLRLVDGTEDFSGLL